MVFIQSQSLVNEGRFPLMWILRKEVFHLVAIPR